MYPRKILAFAIGHANGKTRMLFYNQAGITIQAYFNDKCKQNKYQITNGDLFHFSFFFFFFFFFFFLLGRNSHIVLCCVAAV